MKSSHHGLSYESNVKFFISSFKKLDTSLLILKNMEIEEKKKNATRKPQLNLLHFFYILKHIFVII